MEKQWNIWEDPQTSGAYTQLLQPLENPWKEGKMYGRVFRIVEGEPYLTPATFRITGVDNQIEDVTLWKHGEHEEFAIRNDSDEYGWRSYHFKDPLILEQLTEKISEVGLALATNGQRVQVVLKPVEVDPVSSSNRYPDEDFDFGLNLVACSASHTGLHALVGPKSDQTSGGQSPKSTRTCGKCGCEINLSMTHTYQ